MPGTADDPVKLDPFQRIIEVGWPGGDIAVLVYSYTVANKGNIDWQATLEGLPVIGFATSYQLAGANTANTIRSPSVGLFPPVSQIVTPAMKRFYRMWQYTPYRVTSEEASPDSEDSYVVWWRYNSPEADELPYPGYLGSPASFPRAFSTLGEAEAYRDNFISPPPSDLDILFVEGDPSTTYTKQMRQVVFFSINKIKALLPVGATTFSFRVMNRLSSNDPDDEFASWGATVATFRNEIAFPVDSQNNPLFIPGPKMIDLEQAESPPSVEGGTIPAYRTTFTINLRTLDVSVDSAPA